MSIFINDHLNIEMVALKPLSIEISCAILLKSEYSLVHLLINGESKRMEQRMEQLERTSNGITFYWSSDIPKLIGEDTPSFSTFRRRLKEGKIHIVDVGGRETAYKAEDVQSFLRGELVLQRGGPHRVAKQTAPTRRVSTVGSPYEPELTIDIARASDLMHLYLLESVQLDYMRAVVPPVLHAWTQVNSLVYWLAYSKSNRAEIVAMLGILPLPYEIVQRLIHGEINASQIPASDLLTYRPGEHYQCVIVSASARAGHHDAIMPLMHRAFDDWCKRSVLIDSLYALTPGGDEDSPLARIITNCAFTPQDEEGKLWKLRPFFRKFQPAAFVREYRDCVLHSKKDKKEDKNMLLLEEEKTLSIADLRQLLEDEKREAQKRDFTEIVLKHFTVEDDGRIIRTDIDLNKQRSVYVRPVRNDDDIRATLRINASLFGSSKKYTEDQLVEQRRPWIEKNRDIYRVLEIDGNIIGFLFVMPLPMPIVDRILSGELRVGDISVDDLQEYRPGINYNLYLQTLGVHKTIQDTQKRISGMYLLAGMHKLFVDLARRGVALQSVYTRSNEIDGVKVAAALDMDEITVPGVDSKLVLKLDFMTEAKKSLHAYRTAFDNYTSSARY